MSQDTMRALKEGVWAIATGLCWLYASRGYTTTPRFDLWFWGIAFWLSTIAFAISVPLVVLKR